MWTWIYGIFVSMYMVIHEVSDNIPLRLLPLWVLFLCTVIAAVYSTRYNYRMQYITFVMSIGFVVALLTSLRETGIISTTVLFVVLINIGILLVTALYFITEGKANDMLYMSVGDKCLYSISFIASILTYSLFYALEYGLVTPPVPLIAFSIVILCEWLIVRRFYEGDKDIQDDFTRRRAFERLDYATCVLITFLCAIAHYIYHMRDVFLYSLALVAYLIGGICFICANLDKLYDASRFGLEFQRTKRTSQLLKHSDGV